VLAQATDSTVPLLERLVFLGIFSNNLDEFFRVRVATLTRIISLHRSLGKKDPLEEAERTLVEVKRRVNVLNREFERAYASLRDELSRENIVIVDETALDEQQRIQVRDEFRENIRPHLFPIILDKLRNQTNLYDQSVYLAAELKSDNPATPDTHALIELPTRTVSRFVVLPKNQDGKIFVILLDDVIRYCLSDLFGTLGYNRFSAYTIKFTRDADLSLDNDVSRSYMEIVSESVKKRKYGETVRFIYDEKIPPLLLNKVLTVFGIKKRDTLMKGGKYHNFKDFIRFPKNIGSKKLAFPEHRPNPVRELTPGVSFFDSIRKRDILLHYPYHSFQNIIDLLREASLDSSVRAIKATIYRLAPDSQIVEALINAARNGKEVTVYVELEARFDEEANIHWVDRMQEEEGILIIPKIRGYKVHAKMILIRRKENGENAYYAAIGTGNLNEVTTRIYSDVHILTCDKQITADVNRVFHLLNNERILHPDFKKLVVSPYNTREFFLELLDVEIKNARKGNPAWCVIKINNLTDDLLAAKIYEAALSGVHVDIIIRGICILSPEAMEKSKNFRMIRIIDRFLEHARIFAFANNGTPRYFIGSADWRERNLDSRIEVTMEIHDEKIKADLDAVLRLQTADNVKARLVGGTHEDERFHLKKKTPRIVSQTETHKYFGSERAEPPRGGSDQ
jgi:polyphosphate kinase